MYKEARELQVELTQEQLQIRIAQLQSNVNAFTGMAVCFFAITLGFIVAGYLLFTGWISHRGYTENYCRFRYVWLCYACWNSCLPRFEQGKIEQRRIA